MKCGQPLGFFMPQRTRLASNLPARQAQHETALMAMLPQDVLASAASWVRQSMQYVKPAPVGAKVNIGATVCKSVSFCNCFDGDGHFPLVLARLCKSGSSSLPMQALADGMRCHPVSHGPCMAAVLSEASIPSLCLLWQSLCCYSSKPVPMLTCHAAAGDWQSIAGAAGSG